MRNKTGLKSGSWVALFVLVLGISGVVQSITFKYWESVALPLLLSCFIVVLSAVQLFIEVRRDTKEQTENGSVRPDENSMGKSEWQRLGILFAWIAGFIAGIYVVGFIIAVPLFAFTYLKTQGKGWLASGLFAAVVVAGVYIVFEILLKSPLYHGIVFGG